MREIYRMRADNIAAKNKSIQYDTVFPSHIFTRICICAACFHTLMCLDEVSHSAGGSIRLRC